MQPHHQTAKWSFTNTLLSSVMNLVSSREPWLSSKWVQTPSSGSVVHTRCPTLSAPKLKPSWNILKRATSLHLSLSPNGQPRLCLFWSRMARSGSVHGDYKLTLNQATESDPFPCPDLRTFFATLSKVILQAGSTSRLPTDSPLRWSQRANNYKHTQRLVPV